MLKPGKIKSCATDRDKGGHRDVFSAQMVYIQFSSCEIREEACEVGAV